MTTFSPQLRAMGASEFGGTKLVKLYTHRDLPSQNKVAGDVVTEWPIQNPLYPNSQDRAGMAANAKLGFFHFPAGEECLKHEFKFRQQVGKGEHRRWVPAPSVYGCKWCRERQLNTGSEGTGEQVETKDIEQPSLSAELPNDPGSSPTATEAVKQFPCPLCSWGANTEQGIKAHFTKEHSSNPKRKTRKGAGRKT